MTERFDYQKASPGAFQAMLGLEGHLAKSDLEPSLLHLVKIRASQINSCALCIDMHTKEARQDGESEQRIYGLSCWRETPYYSDKEQAALAWTEANTLIASSDISDELFSELQQHFNQRQLVDLTLAVVAINSWNRIGRSFLPPVGEYQPVR